MANIFSTEPGIVTAIWDPNILPITFVVGGWGGFPLRHAIITGISLSSRGNYQFLNTLRNFTYVYVFGEKMGDITISGQTFMGRCGAGGWSGLSNTIDYYAFAAISWTGMPVGIQLGVKGWWAFLTGIDIGIKDPKTRLGNFSLRFNSIAA
jgi:hypothetical protein